MKALRQAMAWIHTWLGLLAGWILFAMFLTGTASYFRPEITRWMQPELSPPTVSAAHAAQAAAAYMGKTTPHDEQWTIILPDERTAVTRVFSRPGEPSPGASKPKRRPEAMLDPATGAPLTARATRGGEHFYRFHFQLQIPHPWGRWLAGLCAMFMLTAIISGVITHKRIFTDFFTLRWGKGQRSWLDAHNVTAVLALPFHAMIIYTGLITLMAMYMPWPITANYARPAAFTAEASGAPPETPASGVSAPLVDLAPLVEAAQREWNGGRASRVIVRHPGDAAATVTVIRHGGDRLNARGAAITWPGAGGARLSASAPPGPAVATAGVMLGLHMGWFAGPLLRWTYFLLGLSGAAMVATGLVLWTAKRRASKPAGHLGFALVERLNIGAIAALPAGMAAYLLANRLILVGLKDRADLEVATMFWTWFGLAALSCLRPARRAWIETLAIAAALFAAIPVVNTLTTNRGLPGSVLTGDLLFAAFDLAMLGFSAILATASWYAARPRPQPLARVARPRISEDLAVDAA